MPRRVALAAGAVVALVIAGVLVAPIVILGDGPTASSCAQTLVFRGAGYDARPLTSVVQRLAIGVGVVSGCGVPSSNVDVRSLTGIPPTRAVGVSGDATSVYVRGDVCVKTPDRDLNACLRGR